MSTVFTEIQQLEPSALIDLYVLDVTKYGRGLMHFHAGTNELMQDVVWQGITYTRFPMEVTGFEKSSSGALPRPQMKLANNEGIMASYARESNYFLGCKVTRKRTFAKFLDAVNFTAGNPQADPNQSLVDEVWFVDRKSNETPSIIEFELASALDLVGAMLPRRQMIQNCCTWVYRSANCGYVGGPVATEKGIGTSNPSLDKCGKRLSDCKLRYGNNVLPYGGFPGCGTVH